MIIAAPDNNSHNDIIDSIDSTCPCDKWYVRKGWFSTNSNANSHAAQKASYIPLLPFHSLPNSPDPNSNSPNANTNSIASMGVYVNDPLDHDPLNVVSNELKSILVYCGELGSMMYDAHREEIFNKIQISYLENLLPSFIKEVSEESSLSNHIYYFELSNNCPEVRLKCTLMKPFSSYDSEDPHVIKAHLRVENGLKSNHQPSWDYYDKCMKSFYDVCGRNNSSVELVKK